MEYIYDSDSVKKLIGITEEIYLRYKDILDVNYKNDKYYYLIGELTKLSKMEDDILLSFPKTARLLDDVYNSIRKIYRCDNYLMYNFVLNRIDSNICNLCAIAEDNELSVISSISFIDSQDNINSIHDELYFNYILRLNHVIDSLNNVDDKKKARFIQLAHIFSFKNISDAFINNNFCLEENLIERREDSFKDIDLYNSFMYLKNETAFNLCESLLMRNITLSNYYNNKSKNVFYLSNILLFKSLLQEINDSDFIELKNIFILDFKEANSDNYVFEQLKSCFDLEYTRRFSIEKNNSIQVLSEDFSSNLITLLKLEDSLYDKFMNLKLDDFDNFNVISSLINFEKDLVSQLDINMDNASVISFIINRDLGFFIDVYDDSFKKNVIIQRIKNMFNFFRKSDMANGIMEKNYYAIMSNHIVDTLKKYNGDLAIVKLYLYMFPTLTDDFVLMNGNYSMIERFSDDITSKILENSSVYDYCYDKNEQLYKLFTIIIDDLTRYSDMYETDWTSLFDFKICELSDIISCVSDEHLCDIKGEISSLDDGFVKMRVLSLFNNKVH